VVSELDAQNAGAAETPHTRGRRRGLPSSRLSTQQTKDRKTPATPLPRGSARFPACSAVDMLPLYMPISPNLLCCLAVESFDCDDVEEITSALILKQRVTFVVEHQKEGCKNLFPLRDDNKKCSAAYCTPSKRAPCSAHLARCQCRAVRGHLQSRDHQNNFNYAFQRLFQYDVVFKCGIGRMLTQPMAKPPDTFLLPPE
jgi:hypothetical protein